MKSLGEIKGCFAEELAPHGSDQISSWGEAKRSPGQGTCAGYTIELSCDCNKFTL